MSEKERGLEPLELKEGYHGTKEEIAFLKSVIGEIRKTGYSGKISLIGSRAEGYRISRNVYRTFCKTLVKKEYDYWYERINDLVRENDLQAKEIPNVIEKLDENIPIEIKTFLLPENSPDSDFDLAIESRFLGIKPIYIDNGTGVTVDTHAPEDPKL